MREIKLRAWCEALNKPELRLFSLEDIQMGAFALHPDDKVMQYTGLKDKSGKEVYEGDILEFTPMWRNAKERRHATIWYREDDACYWLYFNAQRTSFTGISNLYNGAVMAAEVIGNAYENPTLFDV
jgi:uncharacterized phage protein (TIGR01671 family)